MRATFSIAVCLTLSSSVWAQDAICPADYYPFAVGVEWAYEEDGTVTTEGVTGIQDGLFVLQDDSGAETFWSSDAEGIKVHKIYLPDQEPELQWSYFVPPITRFPYSMELDVEHEDRGLLDIPGIDDLITYVQFNATFVGFEDRVVGDRTYPLCAKITTRDASRSDFMDLGTIARAITTTTEWWAWGIGPVEIQSHVVAWDFMGGETEEWSTVTLSQCTLIEDNPPLVQVTQPTTEDIYGTAAGSIAISCLASDDSRVMKISWQDDHGHDGLAALNGDWQIADIPLEAGKNVVTVTAWDSCGNTSADVLTVYSVSIGDRSPALCHEGESLNDIQLTGYGFPEDALVELSHNGQTIAAANVRVSGAGTLLEFDVDLRDSGVCSWDVVLKHSSQIELATLPGCFRTFSLAVTEVYRTPGFGITISWTSIVDRSYQVWAAPTMDGQWELADSILSHAETTSWEDVSAQDPLQRFYRVTPAPL